MVGSSNEPALISDLLPEHFALFSPRGRFGIIVRFRRLVINSVPFGLVLGHDESYSVRESERRKMFEYSRRSLLDQPMELIVCERSCNQQGKGEEPKGRNIPGVAGATVAYRCCGRTDRGFPPR